MGLSNYLPNSRLNQPGVCTSSTRPASPYEGQVIYQTDDDRVLVWDNSAWVDPSTGKTERSGLVKMIPTSATNGTVSSTGDVSITGGSTQVRIINCFSSQYQNYKVVYNLLTSAGQQAFIRFIDASNNEASSNYGLAGFYQSGNTTLNGAWSTTGGNFEFGYLSSGTAVSSGEITILNPFNTQRTAYSSMAQNAGVSVFYFGTHTTDDSYPSLRMYLNTGSFSTGSNVRIYGYN